MGKWLRNKVKSPLKWLPNKVKSLLREVKKWPEKRPVPHQKSSRNFPKKWNNKKIRKKEECSYTNYQYYSFYYYYLHLLLISISISISIPMATVLFFYHVLYLTDN